MKTFFIALRATIFGAGFILLWGWVALSLHDRYDTALGFALPAWTRILGITAITAGGILALACVATFVTRGQGTPAPFDPPRKFVVAGPANAHTQTIIGENVQCFDVVTCHSGHDRVGAAGVVANHAAQSALGVSGRVRAEGEMILFGCQTQSIKDQTGLDATRVRPSTIIPWTR